MFPPQVHVGRSPFYSLVGIKPKTFYKMLEILKIAESKQKYYGGRKNKIVIEERLLMTLEYWKDYSSYRVIAKRYNISHTSCIRNIFLNWKYFNKKRNF
ncbi:transposase family protein [Spiroplasma endosymbiont of Zeiraphera isertana]|uniref:transposase family protein n=1 Tax=Spiroplasma endosymbiont of Zeiraphera isertana TaxID=3066313 RepID=UPI003CC79CB2